MRDMQAFLKPIAHRGLHGTPGHGAVENTMAAFKAARDRGYGIECDLRPGRDGLPLVFHDLDLDRLVAGVGPVSVLGKHDVQRLAFRSAPSERIPLFADLLALAANDTPLLVEIKSEWKPPDRAFLAEIARLSRNHQGPLALMSFDPDVMAILKDLAPEVPRGIVSGNYLAGGDGDHWWEHVLTRERAEKLTHLLESGPADPSFYAYHVKALPTPVTRYVREVQRLPLFTWTVRDDADLSAARRFADAPIFEGFLA
ncbi:MAG: glycerophosphodiester phosphodiesterase [Bauldia sp.]|nr:glycerophosphodiester phosphodiesterase [Bauldia sp.]MCB1504018.1 glycerophosphodiester phosphodiesterase [Hyphomicrobiaceae bacterium]